MRTILLLLLLCGLPVGSLSAREIVDPDREEPPASPQPAPSPDLQAESPDGRLLFRSWRPTEDRPLGRSALFQKAPEKELWSAGVSVGSVRFAGQDGRAEALLSPDGRALVVVRSAPGKPDDGVLLFYAEGRLMTSWPAALLDPAGPVSPERWSQATFSFQEEGAVLLVTLPDGGEGRRLEFDALTGSRRRTPMEVSAEVARDHGFWIACAIAAGLLGALGVLLILYVRGKNRTAEREAAAKEA